MEALTNHTTVIPELNFISLLKGLYAMVNSDWPRSFLVQIQNGEMKATCKTECCPSTK
jgi:hypothetical protein